MDGVKFTKMASEDYKQVVRGINNIFMITTENDICLIDVYGNKCKKDMKHEGTYIQLPTFKCKAVASTTKLIGHNRIFYIDMHDNLYTMYLYSDTNRSGHPQISQNKNPVEHILYIKAKHIICGIDSYVLLDNNDDAHIFTENDMIYMDDEIIINTTHIFSNVSYVVAYESGFLIIDTKHNLYIYSRAQGVRSMTDLKIKFVACKDHHIMVIDIYGNIWYYDKSPDSEYIGTFNKIPNVCGCKNIALCDDHIFVVDDNNDLWLSTYNNGYIFEHRPGLEVKYVISGYRCNLLLMA
jgi:hypothetical protein